MRPLTLTVRQPPKFYVTSAVDDSGPVVSSGVPAFSTPVSGNLVSSGYFPYPGNYYGCTQIVGKCGLYSQTSFIYKYETLRGFIKGVSGGCFVLENK